MHQSCCATEGTTKRTVTFTINEVERVNGRKPLLSQVTQNRNTVERSHTNLSFGALQAYDQRGQYCLKVHAVRLLFVGLQERSGMAQGDSTDVRSGFKTG